VLHKKGKINRFLLLLMVGFALVLKPESAKANVDPILDPKVNNDIILVLDTSYSMIGKPGRDIFDQVKNSIYWFIDNRVKDGDRIFFMTFDQDVKVYPEFIVDSKNDRDIVKKFISVIEAKGQWTYTLRMLAHVFDLADRLTQEAAESKAKRKVAIFIMSDGLDDPPPANVRDRFKLSDVTDKYQGRGDDWWIYISNFQDLRSSKQLSDSYERFKRELGKVGNVRFMDDGDPSKAIEDVLPPEDNTGKIFATVLLIMLVLLLLIGLILLLKKLLTKEIVGRFEYWNNELLKPDVYNVKISGYQKSEILLGRTMDCTVRIKEYESRYPFKLKAVKKDGKVILKISASGNLEIGFQNREADGFLLDGDTFIASNITFKYIVD